MERLLRILEKKSKGEAALGWQRITASKSGEHKKSTNTRSALSARKPAIFPLSGYAEIGNAIKKGRGKKRGRKRAAQKSGGVLVTTIKKVRRA